MIFKVCHGLVWLVRARPSLARQHVTQYGNWDNFLRRGLARSGTAQLGVARLGTVGQNACRWAVSPDTFLGKKQGNQSKTT